MTRRSWRDWPPLASLRACSLPAEWPCPAIVTILSRSSRAEGSSVVSQVQRLASSSRFARHDGQRSARTAVVRFLKVLAESAQRVARLAPPVTFCDTLLQPLIRLNVLLTALFQGVTVQCHGKVVTLVQLQQPLRSLSRVWI